ncbi:hypothetical protein [Flavobacterium tiangeerense]|jgi:hypothetical protein|uniref:hypothetical protein n=1 Tax=Flavobacterium tiangeerense TaxID=459471 RepID=UPI0011AAC61D|nr:hypothetical protein [Flavobacterium tiangeerense]
MNFTIALHYFQVTYLLFINRIENTVSKNKNRKYGIKNAAISKLVSLPFACIKGIKKTTEAIILKNVIPIKANPVYSGNFE